MNKQLATSQEYDLSAIDRADLADTTRYKYRREVDKYLNTEDKNGNKLKLGDYETLTEYAAGLTKSRRAFLKAAVRLVTKEYENRVKAGATPDNIGTVQAAVYRLEALNDAVKVQNGKGNKAHTWLKHSDVVDIMSEVHALEDELTFLRDRVILGLLLGAGLRRDELVNLTFGAVSTVPNGDGDRDVISVKGKGSKNRVIPISEKLASYIEDWRQFLGAGPDDLIARSLGRSKQVGDSISAVAVFHLVRKYGAMIGKPKLAPHDLRRTYAQLGLDGGVSIIQISKLLGHASIDTTQRYLDLSTDYDKTISDYIPI